MRAPGTGVSEVKVHSLSLAKGRQHQFALNLDPVWADCNVALELRSTPEKVMAYLPGYLAGIGAKTAVIEPEYIDRDYLDDYARYYAKCFDGYERTCYRVHFFDAVYDQPTIDKFILSTCDESSDDEPRKKLAQFENSYLGFVVIRPLPETIIGRTCLCAYPERERTRQYKALRNVKVSFFGRKLSVRCMPFQQQDSATAACATCSLWSAFQVTSELFGHKTYFPCCITSMAVGHGLSEMRSFPNGGLFIEDMAYAIRAVGLDPICMDESGAKSNETEQEFSEIFLGAVYSYLAMGLPIILTGTFAYEDEKNGNAKGDWCDNEAHAVTINGFNLKSEIDTNTWLVSSGIDKLYVHDDQVGPGAKIEIDKGGATKWHTDWKGEGEKPLCFNPRHLLIPAYHKIRVCYEDVYYCARKMSVAIDGAVKGLIERERISSKYAVNAMWDIRLLKGEDYKASIRRDIQIEKEERLKCLKKGCPKYVWDMKVLLKGVPLARFAIDATDAGQGMKAFKAFFYTERFFDVWTSLLVKNDHELCRNPLYRQMDKEFLV